TIIVWRGTTHHRGSTLLARRTRCAEPLSEMITESPFPIKGHSGVVFQSRIHKALPASMRLSLYGRQPCTLPISVFDLLFKSDYSQPAPVCQEPAAFLPAAQFAASRQPRRGMAAAAIRG